MHSRLDYFFMSNVDKHRIIECDKGVRDICGHAGLYLTLHLGKDHEETLWRLNNNLTDYMEYSNKEDAAKSVLRGKLINNE